MDHLLRERNMTVTENALPAVRSVNNRHAEVASQWGSCELANFFK